MLSGLRDTVLRLLPHATTPGLRAIGEPDQRSPVLVTGNYALTVRRLERVLSGRNAWLLVCNSRGINVWCAATGGHLTDGDLIAAIRASRLADRVGHRTLVLPQLAATGIEPYRVETATGFKGTWGPARLEDLPLYLDDDGPASRSQRRMRFPLWERLEMAVMWAVPMGVACLVAGLVVGGIGLGLIAGVAVAAEVFAIFALLPRLVVVGRGKWPTYVGAAVAGSLACAVVAALGGILTPTVAAALVTANVAAMAVFSIDVAGTTPWYPGSINSVGNHFHLELVEDLCTGVASCVDVCPCEVLALDDNRLRIELAKPEACVLCGACIVQCPEDALRFRFEDGRVVEAETVRATRVNMLGRRAVTDPE